MKKNYLSVLLVLMAISLFAQVPTTVSTFHNISVYWTPNGGADNIKVLMQYRLLGSEPWLEALAMEHRVIANVGNNETTGERYDVADYRGSIVNLTPGQTYEIKVKLDGTQTSEIIQATTWSEIFPIGQTLTPGNLNTTYAPGELNGTADAYILIDGTGSTIDINNNFEQCIFLENSNYVIIRGYTLKNARKHGIQLANCKNIVIEDCDISGWGEEDVAGSGFGVDRHSAIFAPDHDAAHCVFQRNLIHNPRWDTNSWAELHDPNDPDSPHPEGPQGISLGYCDIGNNVIRYNEFWSDDTHYFNDLIGYGPNSGYNGSPGPDSDIYGNYLSYTHDDAIESEGGNRNVRIWNNYMEKALIGIANAVSSIGPLYVWRNVTGTGYEQFGAYNDHGGFIKMGHAGNINRMTGKAYIFNNTVLQPGDHGLGGLGTHDESTRVIRHCQSRNNILHVRTNTTHSASDDALNSDYDFDYDLLNKAFPDGHEEHGITNTTPTYAALSFDYATRTGDFRLAENTPGFDDGLIIPNFIDVYQGAGPDRGAHENGTPPMVFGVNAAFVAPLPVEYLSPLRGVAFAKGIHLTWTTATEINADKFIVQKLSQNNDWVDIQTVSAGKESYQVVDLEPVKGSNLYRLRQIDLDGKYTLSNIVDVEWHQERITQLAPNPTSGWAHFSHDATYDIVVKNQLGQVVLVAKDVNEIQLAQKGIFYVFYTNEQGRENGQVVLVVL